MKTSYRLSEAAFRLDGKMPLKQAIPLGLQHVLAMFVGNLTPLLIITGACGIAGGEFADLQLQLLQNAMLVAGIVTLVQLFAIGPVGGCKPLKARQSSPQNAQQGKAAARSKPRDTQQTRSAKSTAGRQNTSARSRSTGTKQSRSTASRSKKQQTGGESRVALGIILAALVLGLIARAISMGLV